MFELFAFNIEEISENINTLQLLQYVDADKQERITKLRYQSDVRRILMADLLIRAIACRYLDLNNKDLELEINEYGKPYLNGVEAFHFNLSHSGKWVVCVTDNEAIGIDIEEIAPIEMDIAKTYFSAEEFDYIMEKNEEDRVSLFYDFWTLKESYIKAQGYGLNLNLNSFTVTLKDDGSAVIKDTQALKPAFLRQYPLDEKYRLSLCAFNSDFPAEIRIVDMEWILNSIN